VLGQLASHQDPKTTKYSDVDITGEMTLCISVRRVRAISNR
jgi:hypothetical protein